VSEPIIFISRNRIKAGKLEEFRTHYQESLPSIHASKPGTIVQLAYEDETSTEVVIVRLFPSADGLDLQIQGADERSKKTYELIEPLSIEIYGTPSPATLERMLKIGGSGIDVKINSQYLGGFIR